MGISVASSKCLFYSMCRGRIGIWECWFLCREKNRRIRRKTLGAGIVGEPRTNSTHMWHQHRESNLSHNSGRRVLLSLRHPCSPKYVVVNFVLYTKFLKCDYSGDIEEILFSSPYKALQSFRMKAKEFYQVVPFIWLCKVVLPFELVNETLKCADHSNESYRAVHCCGAVFETDFWI